MLKSLSQLPEEFKVLLRAVGNLPGFIGFVDMLFIKGDELYGDVYCVFDSRENMRAPISMEVVVDADCYLISNSTNEDHGYSGIHARIGWNFIEGPNLVGKSNKYRIMTKEEYMEEL